MIIHSMVRASSPILIGRSDEAGHLRAVLARTAERRSSTTLISGEAGVGKTRLVSDFVEHARATGAEVLEGGCVLLGDGALPYAPVVEALRGLVRRTPAEELDALVGAGRSELARLVPDLGSVTEDLRSGLSIGSGQGRLFELLLSVLQRLADRSPTVFIVEDLHWSDQSTRDLLGFLVRNLRDVPVMLVFTYRSDELHRRHPLLPFVAELTRTPGVERIELAPLDGVQSAELLRAIAGRDLEPALVESIHVRSAGNPFFTEELLMASGADGRTDLPPNLRDLLLARIAGLSEPTQEFLRVASAAGQRVDPALLAAAMSIDSAEMYEALRECVGRQVLVHDPTAGVERYAFRHALLQEAVYDDLLPGEKTRLHAAFARTLESSFAGDVSHAAELAYHWFAAHDLPRALESAVAAGLAAEAAYAFPEATAQFERALELWDRVPGAEEHAGRDRIDLLAELASVARFHDAARAVTHVQAAIRVVDEDAEPVRAGLLYERLGRYAWIAGQGELANQAHRTAIRLIPAEPPSEARARAVAGLAQISVLGARFDEALILAEEALTIARAIGARDIEGHALNSRGLSRAVRGDIDLADADLRTALAIAEDVGIVDDIGRAYANWTWVFVVAGRLDESIAMARRAVAVSERLGLMRFFGAHLLCGAADDLYHLGRWDEAEESVLRAEAQGLLGINGILIEELKGRLALARGRFDEAARHLEPLARLAERAADIQFISPVSASLTELALWQGKPDRAATIATEAIRLIDFTPEVRIGELFALCIRAHADAAELARVRRLPDLANAAIDAGMSVLAAMRGRHARAASRPALVDQSASWLLLCEAEATRLDRRADPAAWAATVEAWRRLDRPYALAYARWREAEARLAAREARDEAVVALREAHDIATRLGAAPLLGEIVALAARARLPLVADADGDDAAEGTTPAADDADFGLTAREREVLALVALGRTNRQIADELFISQNTAGVHVSNILGKLGVAGRGEAAAIAYRLGLIEPASIS